MEHSESSADGRQPRDVAGGVRLGLGMAAGFSALAAVALVVGAREGAAEAARMWALASLFYVAAGALGGALYGALRPVQHRYWGRCLTAYLILLLVYGGGTVALLPLMREPGEKPVPLSVILPLWAVICLVLAPIYVAVNTRSARRGPPPEGAP